MKKKSSAFKKNKLALRNRAYNKKYKSSIKNIVKKYLFNIKIRNNQEIDTDYISENISSVYQKIDKAVKRKVLHKNTAARKKSRLAKIMHTTSD